MKSVLFSVIVTLAMFSHTANANEIKTKSQALSACKTQVEESFSDVHRSKLKKARNKKDHFAVRLMVTHGDQKEAVTCNVNKGTGAVTIIK